MSLLINILEENSSSLSTVYIDATDNPYGNMMASAALVKVGR